MMRLVGFIAFFAFAFLLVSASDGSDPCRGRQVAVQRVQVGQAYSAAVATHAYQQAYYQNVYVPQVVEVAVAPLYYFSARDYIRDQALLEAVRALGERASAGPSTPARQSPDPMPPATSERKTKIQTPVDDKLAAIVKDACAKCHAGGASKGGFSVDNLGSMPAGARWHMYALVNSGEMPEGANALPDDDVKVFYEFAKSGSKAESLTKKR